MALSSLNTNFVYGSYTADRDNFLIATENQTARAGIVDDGKQIPTIGIGFNISGSNFSWSTTSALLTYALGGGHAAELSILQAWRLHTLVDPAAYTFIDFTDGKHAGNTLNNDDILLMAGEKVDGERLSVAQQLLSGFTLSAPQQKTLLDGLLDGTPTPISGFTPYETLLTNKLTKLGAGTVAPSEERVSLISLAYNSTNLSLIGPGLASAIASDQRGLAWYQIAYGNTDISYRSLELRHQFEADNFGLFAASGQSNTTIGPVLSQIYQSSTVYSAIDAKIGLMYSLARYKDTLPDAVQKWLAPYDGSSSVDTVDYGTGTEPIVPAGVRNILTFSQGGQGTVAASLGGVLIGQNDATTLLGGPGTDTIIANGAGAVSLSGGAGDDTLIANDGADMLTGGAGRDVMVAGNGPDIFVYTDPIDSQRGSTGGTSLTLSDAYAARDGSAMTGTEWFLVSLSKTATTAVSFTWQTADLPAGSTLFNAAVAGTDYSAVGPTTVTIPVGQSSVWLPVTLKTVKKPNYDFTRDFGVTLSSLTGAAAIGPSGPTAIGHILDDHGYRLFPILQVPDTVAPEGGAARVLLSLSSQPLTNVTISYTVRDGTAVAGTDYTPPVVTPITLFGSMTSAALSIPTPIDATTDGDKYFFIDWTITSGAARFAGGAATQTSEVDIKANDGHRQDVIYGFKAATDQIDLSGFDANLLLPGNQTLRFIGTANFTGAGQVRYTAFGADTLVQANVDGSNLPNLQIELAGTYHLTPANFIFTPATPSTTASVNSYPTAASVDLSDAGTLAATDLTAPLTLADPNSDQPASIHYSIEQVAAPAGTGAPGQTVSGAITSPGGEDSYDITLTAGQIYDITAFATDGTSGEAYLTLYDQSGNILSYANAGLDVTAELNFSPTVTEIYVIGASMEDQDYTGAYDLSVNATAAAPGQSVLGFSDTYELVQPAGSGTNMTFLVRREGDTTATTTVDYQANADLAGENAEASDFAGGVFPSGTLTFAPGQTSQAVVVGVAATGFPDSRIFELDLSNPSGGSLLDASAATGEIAGMIACYMAGTLIATPSGERPVETLCVGDETITISGRTELIRWVGNRTYAGPFLRSNPAIQPIRFRAESLGDGLPRRDLLVSPEHAMFLDGILIPARCLVNGSTITQERGLDRVDYFHVELDSHDVLLAEGAPSESFMDDDSRGMFHNAAEFDALYPNAQASMGFCAPRVDNGPELDALRCRLAGNSVHEVHLNGAGLHNVTVPAGASAVRLVTNSGYAPGDKRRLGAAVSRVVIDGCDTALVSAKLATGWHPCEGSWRWTDGAALLIVAGAKEIEVMVEALPFAVAA